MVKTFFLRVVIIFFGWFVANPIGKYRFFLDPAINKLCTWLIAICCASLLAPDGPY